MEDQELILRFFAINYNDGYNNYKKGFKEFLNTTMQEFNQLDDADLKK